MVIAAPIATKTTESLKFTRTINAPANTVYKTLTQQDHLIYWLSDGARTQNKDGGYLLLTWFPNAYVIGAFTALEENKYVAYSWRAGTESSISQVEIQIKSDAEDATTITLTHNELADEANPADYERQWDNALDNLVSYLEDGADLRVANRVLIGIVPGALDADIAARLGVPVTEGVRITGLIPNLSAEKAGLQAEDVIVEAGGLTINNDTPIFNATGGKKPGDVISVGYYRGAEKHTAQITLMGYPIPETATTYAAMAEQYRPQREGFVAQLDGLLNGVSDAHAAQKPEPKEWSANEVMAHLILNERNFQNMIGSIVNEGPWPEGWSTNNDSRINSITQCYATKEALVNELKRCWLETELLVKALPENGNKGAFWWVNFELYSFANHTAEHMRQIKSAIEAARG